MLQQYLLSLMIWIPVLGGALALSAGKDAQRARYIAITTAIISMLLCIPLYRNFNTHTYAMQFVENFQWVTVYDIRYHLGVDGISTAMVILTTLTTLVVIMASWGAIREKVSQFMAAFLIMQGMMVGMFCAIDSILFYIFWEGMLIPIYISIGVWGSYNRSYASIKFFLYTFAGSALMLVALLYLALKAHSFYILDYYTLPLSLKEQTWLFLAFLLAFAVKIPMWPVHTWLPDAHTEAPAGGSVVLAALMLKMGVYGFLRFSMPITPDASQELSWLMIVLSLVAIIYIGLVAIAQTDMKRLIAYSSIAHMGIATLGCFMIYTIIASSAKISVATMSLEGAMVQMISHAFSTGALFVSIGILYDQMHSRQIKDFGGLVASMPLFSTLFMIFSMANVGLPGTSGFVGEFLVILSLFRANWMVALLTTTTIVLSAAYTLWLYKRVFFGPVANPKVAALHDVNGLNKLALIILAVIVIAFGFYPEPLLAMFHATIGHILEWSTHSKV